MKYERAKLVGRKWHKVVLEGSFADDLESFRLKARVEKALARLTSDYMNKNMGGLYLVMVETDDDLVMLRMMTGFTDEEYRGYGDWSKMKYTSRAGNRIKRES